jgi:Flp pilus assembly protein TadD
MRLMFASVVLSLLAVGCNALKPPNETAAAKKRWNEARASVLYGLAQDQYKGHDFDKCKETCDQALKLVPESCVIHTLLARVEIEQGQLEQAERDLEMARKDGPREAEPHYLSGVIYQRWQRPQTALEFYHQASQRAPAELAYLLAEGEMLVTLGRTDEALQLLQAKVTYFENSPTIRDAVGQILMQKGQYSNAADMFRQASLLSEDDLSIRERLAVAYYRNKQYRECAQVLGRLIEKEPYSKRADLFELLGQSQMQLANAHEARNSFERASELNPYSATAWQNFGRAALEVGDLKRADFALRRAIGVNASVGETHLLMGYVRIREGKLNEALGSFRKANSLAPADTTAICMIGYVYEKMGQTDKAMKYYAQALKVKPGDDLASQLMAAIEK